MHFTNLFPKIYGCSEGWFLRLCVTKRLPEALLTTIMDPGCNIGSKTPLAKQGKLPLKFTCPATTFTCHACTLFNKGELHCEDFAQNITCRAGQVMFFFRLPDCHFLLNLLATWNRASAYVMLHAGIQEPNIWTLLPPEGHRSTRIGLTYQNTTRCPAG